MSPLSPTTNFSFVCFIFSPLLFPSSAFFLVFDSLNKNVKLFSRFVSNDKSLVANEEIEWKVFFPFFFVFDKKWKFNSIEKTFRMLSKHVFPLTKGAKKALEENSKSISRWFIYVCVPMSCKSMCVIFQTNFSSFSKLTSVKRMTESCFSLVAHSTTFLPSFLMEIFTCQCWGEFKFQFSSILLR